MLYGEWEPCRSAAGVAHIPGKFKEIFMGSCDTYWCLVGTCPARDGLPAFVIYPPRQIARGSDVGAGNGTSTIVYGRHGLEVLITPESDETSWLRLDVLFPKDAVLLGQGRYIEVWSRELLNVTLSRWGAPCPPALNALCIDIENGRGRSGAG